MNNTEYAEFCSRCGTPLAANDWHSAAPAWNYTPYHTADSSDGLQDETIDDVKAEDLAAVVGSNQPYYMARFRRMARGGSGGWNWAAFLLSPYWLFYRKQYLLGTVYLIVYMLTGILSGIVTSSIPIDGDAAAMQIAMQEMQGHVLFFPCMALAYIWLAMIILLGIKGNAFYLSHCKKKISATKEKIPDISAGELGVSGGISVGMAILAFVIARIGVNIVVLLLQNWI